MDRKPKTWPDEETAASATAVATMMCWCRHLHFDQNLHLIIITATPVMLSLVHQELSSTWKCCVPENNSPLPLPGKWFPRQASFLKLCHSESKFHMGESHWWRIAHRPKPDHKRDWETPFWGKGTDEAGNSPKQSKKYWESRKHSYVGHSSGAIW